MDMSHRVRVFVCTASDEGIRHLLVRRKPRTEWTWGPKAGPIGYDEQFEQAVAREARELGFEQGLILDLDHFKSFLIGGIGVTDWDFGFQLTLPTGAGQPQLKPSDDMEFRWANLGGTLQTIIDPSVAEALIRLELLLQVTN